MDGRHSVIVATIAAGIVTGALLIVLLLPWGASESTPPTAAQAASSGAVRKISATLFYVSDDGLRLVGVPRDVPYASTPVDQARSILEEQLKPPPAPLAPAIPDGVKLRALYLTDHGDAFVDLSREVSSAHSGGSLDELFSVYAIVNALTTNLPAISGVQILVDGREVDTLAGHVDVRRPLQKNLKWVQESGI